MTLQSKREAWDVIFKDPNLSLRPTACQAGLRSVCWKVYLGYFSTLETGAWPSIQAKQRKRYADLRRQYIEEPAERIAKKSNEDADLTANNPLALNDNNPWQQYFADSEIRKVIRQDVERTFPDVDYFRSKEVQEKMTDILFIYCKLNQDVSYRQGMHELLAPLYWVVATDSFINDEGSVLDATNKLITQVLDPAYVEHDTYILFEHLMKYAKPWYEFNERVSISSSTGDLASNNIPRSRRNTRSNLVVACCQRIHHQYLSMVDPVLYRHLERFRIEPQLYGMRWLRLLFGREFEFRELLKLWDAIFAQDPTLQIVEYISLALLLRMRDKLLANEYAECLTLLMRCPQVGSPGSLVEQARYLQGDLTEASGLHVLQQNDLRAGRPPRHSLWDGVVSDRPPQLANSNSNSNRIAHRRSHGANLDGLASITRGVMKSPQVRDLNKAIAGVMGTVQKNVNMLGDNVLNRTASFDSPITRRRQTLAPPELPADYFSSRQQQQNNKKMGDLLTKCIGILEHELFTKEAGPDEISLVNALAGIKHVRDVLSGKQEQFDPSVMEAAKDIAKKPSVITPPSPPPPNPPQATTSSNSTKSLSSPVVYRIEDLLSDLSLEEDNTSKQTKFKWRTDENHPSSKTPPRNNKPSSSKSGPLPMTSDPLDAQNV